MATLADSFLADLEELSDEEPEGEEGAEESSSEDEELVSLRRSKAQLFQLHEGPDRKQSQGMWE